MKDFWLILSSQQAVTVLVPIGLSVALVALCLIFWKLVDKWLFKLSQKAIAEIFDLILRSNRSTLLPWCFLAGFYLALQDTLSNLFAGDHIILGRNVRTGALGSDRYPNQRELLCGY